MARLPRSKLKEGVYHVLNRGVNGTPILSDPRFKDRFVSLLRSYREQRPVRLLHWVVMDDHFHLVLEFLRTEDLSAFMAGLQLSYTAYHHRIRREQGLWGEGHLWSGRYKCTLVERDPGLASLGRYVERNPLRAGEAALPWDWPWSSARAYALGEPDGLTDTDYHPQHPFPKAIGDVQTAWRRYLLDPAAQTEERLFQGCRHHWGSKAFQRRILRRNGRPTVSHRGRKRE